MIKPNDYVTLKNGGGIWLVLSYDKKTKLFEIKKNINFRSVILYDRE